MNELPHIAFTPASLAHPQGIHLGQGSQTLAAPEQNRKISATWATNLDDVRSAQRLRFNVFAGEMGARLNTPVAGYDIDLFDDYCVRCVTAWWNWAAVACTPTTARVR